MKSFIPTMMLMSLVWAPPAFCSQALETTNFRAHELREVIYGELDQTRDLWITIWGKGPFQIFPLPDKLKVTNKNCVSSNHQLALAVADTTDSFNVTLGLMCVPSTRCKTFVKNDMGGIQDGFLIAWNRSPIVTPAHDFNLLDLAVDLLFQVPPQGSQPEVRHIDPADAATICVSDSL